MKNSCDNNIKDIKTVQETIGKLESQITQYQKELENNRIMQKLNLEMLCRKRIDQEFAKLENKMNESFNVLEQKIKEMQDSIKKG